MASSPDVDEVSLMLRRSLRKIQTVTKALNKLNDFLEATDAESVEKLLSQLAESSLEQTEEKDCIVKFSEIVQVRRVVDFLSRAGKRIHNRVSEIRNREEEGTSEGGVVEGNNRRIIYSFVNEYFDSSNNDVFALLTEGSQTGSTLSIPGSGRRGALTDSFLANRNFDRPYWVEESGLYKIRKMLENGHQLYRIVQDKDHARRRMKQIDRVTRHSVQRNRYMFAFDDGFFHWEFQGVMERALRGKFELIRSPLYKFGKSKCLSTAESWKLFCRIAFRDEPGSLCPVELQQVSEEIVEMCKGFPLPIVGIAGLLLNTKKQELEWQRVRNSFKVEVKTRLPLPLTRDIDYSFRRLPCHLMPCFLYFGIFPPDSVIPNEKLFKLWIAEGFVGETTGKMLEEVAEEYLNELIRRNLVQSFQGLNRLERFCKLDNPRLLRLIRIDAQGLYTNTSVDIDRDVDLEGYRLSICTEDNVDPTAFNSDLHSLFVFSDVWNIDFLIDVIKQCGTLTVLDFEYHPIKELPEEFGKLIHLKYLSVNNTKLRKLPKSMDKLVNLQTLDVRNTLIEINMLNKLRHLLASVCDDGISEDPSQGVRLKKGIGRLHNLQTLMTVEVQDNDISIIKEIEMLKQLRTLGVSGLSAKTVKALCACIDKLVLLKSLTLQAKDGEEVLNLGSVSSELPLLQRLVLKGQFYNLPYWIFRLQNLSVLCLCFTKLTEEQLILLSHLPNLVTLWLCRAYEGERLYFKQGSFKKLKILVLREFHGLYELEIEDGALPSLEELRIGSSPLLNEVPSGIQYLKNLEILINYDMPNEFVVRMQPSGGLDYWKVKHIHSVFFLCRVQGRKYKLFELGEPELLDHLLGVATNAYHITEPQDEHEFTFYDEDKHDVNPTVLRRHTQQWSFTSSRFTDDVEM